MTKAAFFELEPWEAEYLSKSLGDLDLALHSEHLDLGTAEKARDAEILSIFIRSHLDAPLLEQMPGLRFVTTRSTGFDHIALDACSARGILVANVPYYAENTVAEHTFALILALSRNVHKAYQQTSKGDFSLAGLRGFDLKGKTLGVIGAGAIGLHAIRIAKGFGMNVLCYDVRQNHLMAEVLGFRYASLEELLAQSDIVSLHAPYNEHTHHLLNRERMGLIKRGALLINTARGALVDTEALIWALDQGILAGAGLDVLEGEELIQEEGRLLASPSTEESLRLLLQDHVLMHHPNVVISPHLAFYSQEALQRILDTTVANIRSFLRGNPQNLVRAQ